MRIAQLQLGMQKTAANIAFMWRPGRLIDLNMLATKAYLPAPGHYFFARQITAHGQLKPTTQP